MASSVIGKTSPAQPSLDGSGGGETPDRSGELLVLDSLFDVVKSLPGLTKEPDNIYGYYYVQGMIGTSDQESLYDYTKRVGELTLGVEEPASRVAPHVLARIGQLQDPNPLFPSLHRLRIMASSPSLHFLHLFLSPALTTLELKTTWDESIYSSVLSFLECAVDQAPTLSSLILGPGRLRAQILNVSLRHKNLRRLELLEVETYITDRLLHDIGSLPVLETWKFDIQPCSKHRNDSALFSTLRTLEIDQGPFELIKDLVEKVSSIDLRVLSIDVTEPLKGIPPSDGRKRDERPSADLRSTDFEFDPLPLLSMTNIATLVRSSIKKWVNTLFSVTLKNTCHTTFRLPSDIFEDLVLCPNMKQLEMTGMEIDSIESALDHLKDARSLEVLHLPVDASRIPLRDLRRIAESCPRLVSLRCWFMEYSIVNISEPLSHGLEKLSVGNGQNSLKRQKLLDIAKYVDSIFPNVEIISVNKVDDWEFISDLVNLCKWARKEEHRRFGGLATTMPT